MLFSEEYEKLYLNTSYSPIEGLPTKLAKTNAKKKNKIMTYPGKGSWFSPRINRKWAIHIEQVPIKMWVENTVSEIYMS